MADNRPNTNQINRTVNDADISELIHTEIVEHRTNLVRVKYFIEDELTKQLNPDENKYVERMYMETLSKLWLTQINDTLQQFDSNQTGNILKTLGNIKTLIDIPESFNKIPSFKLLIKHKTSLDSDSESKLISRFKDHCVQFCGKKVTTEKKCSNQRPSVTSRTTNDAEATKQLIDDMIFKEVRDHRTNLVRVKYFIEDKFHKPLGPVDIAYVEAKYIEILSQFWLSQTKETMRQFAADKTENILEIFRSLNNIKSMRDLPEFFESASLELVMNHYTLLDESSEDKLICQLKEYCLQTTISLNTKVENEIKFYNAFFDFLTDSINFQKISADLDLKGVYKPEFSFDSMLDAILKLDRINNGEKLESLLKTGANLKGEKTLYFLDTFRDAIMDYVKPIEILETNKDNRLIIEVIGKNIALSEILTTVEIKLSGNSDIEEIRFVVADVIHIDRDLKNDIWHGKNIVVLTKLIKVHNDVTWNVSGKDNTHTYSTNVGTELGHGKTGADGYAGESGGNVFISAEQILNPLMLTILSNGGVGSKGQDGGDGLKGVDGKGIKKNELEKLYPSPVRFFQNYNLVDGMGIQIDRDCDIQKSAYNGGRYMEGVTKEGNKLTFSYTDSSFLSQCSQCYFIYKGSLGRPGGRGGKNGLGGKGGYPGEIKVKNQITNREFNVWKHAERGEIGIPGKGGLYGEHGKNGWDMGYLDYQLWTNLWYFGKDRCTRLQLEYSCDSTEDSVWCFYKLRYARLKTFEIEHKKNQRCDERMRARHDEEYQHHAVAVRKKGFSEINILNSYAHQLKSGAKGILIGAIEFDKEAALEALIEMQRERKEEQSELTIRRQANYVNKTKERFAIQVKACVFVKNINISKISTKILEEGTPSAILNNWIELKSKNLDGSTLQVLINKFEAVKDRFCTASNLEENILQQLAYIEKLLINKKRLHIFENVAKQQQQDYIKDEKILLSAESAARYLCVDHETDKDISDPLLGTLHQYLYQNEYQHKEVLSYCRNNAYKKNLEQSLRDYCLQTAQKQEANEAINALYKNYQDFVENSKNRMKLLLEPFHNELLQLHMQNENFRTCKPFKSKFEEYIRTEKLLGALYMRLQKEAGLNFNWLDEYSKNGPFKSTFEKELQQKSKAYRLVLAHAFGTNIRVYVEGVDNKLELYDNHNSRSDRFTHIQLKADKLIQLKVNEDHLRLEMDRQQKANLYEQVLAETNECKTQQQLLDYLPCRPRAPMTIADIEKVHQTLDDENTDIQRILEYFTTNEKSEVEMLLQHITSKYLTQSDILRRISYRFSTEGRHISMPEFRFLINAIVASAFEEINLQQFFSWIVSAYPQANWIDELILLQIENHMRKRLPTARKLREYLAAIHNIDILLLFSAKLDNCRSSEMVSIESITHTLYLLSRIPKDAVLYLEGLNLSEWSYALKEIYWSFLLSKLVDWQPNDLETALYYTLSMEAMFGFNLVENFFEIYKKKQEKLTPGVLHMFHSEEWILNDTALEEISQSKWKKKMNRKYSSKSDRKLEQLVELIKSKKHTSQSIICNLSGIGKLVRDMSDTRWEIDDKLIGEFGEGDIKRWVQNFRTNTNFRTEPIPNISQWTKKLKNIIMLANKQTATAEQQMFAVIERAIELKRAWKLRDAQRVAIQSFLTNEKNTLAQVATGEGKSIIVVVLSIVKALSGEKVDVVTSSSVLAKRDSIENKDIYDLFGITVAHNCSDEISKRKEVYSGSQVVYGDLTNFQRDYLLDQFYSKNIIGDRKFENVIIDEVDSMLLDKGNNMLYLSHDLPGLDKLESVYLFIWQWLNRPALVAEDLWFVFDSDTIAEAVLHDLYGLIRREHLRKLDSALNMQQCDTIYENLIKAKIIDDHGLLIKQSLDECDLNEVLPSDLNVYKKRLAYFLKENFERERCINVPNYLKPFIERHLKIWIENAKTAFFMKAEQDYVVDVDRTGARPDLNPVITILDRDTGTDQANSEWEQALHQFLQLKHGCKLSTQSLKAVFISNVSYFKLYKKLYGMTGTLGSQRERELLQTTHNVDFVTIPTSKSKQFTEYKAILCHSQEEWLKKIKDTVLELITKRSVLIICETVSDVELVHDAFGGKDSAYVHTYSREYENFDRILLDGKMLEGQVVIATNLAGRGTDIKITTELEKAGGLHICLTYLPNNERILQQAFGRAARKGDRGSGQLIVWKKHSKNETIFDLKRKCYIEELCNLSDIKTHYENYIVAEEKCFDKFKKHYEKLKNYLHTNKIAPEIEKIVLHSCLDKWSFWLDEFSNQIKHLNDDRSRQTFDKQMEEFLQDIQLDESYNMSWLELFKGNPFQKVKVAKCLFQNTYTREPDYETALVLFNQVIREEPKHSEAAHYYKAFILSQQIGWQQQPLNKLQVKSFRTELLLAAKLFENNFKQCIKASVLIGNIKKINKEHIIQINAFEQQQEAMANLYRMFVQSIGNIVGHNVTPHLLVSDDIAEDFAVDVYEDLLSERIIGKPRVANVISSKNLKQIISNCGGVGLQKLKDFICVFQGQEIVMSELEEGLQSQISLPSREACWQLLHEHGILTDSIRLITVEMDALKDVDGLLWEKLVDMIEKKKLTNLQSTFYNECFFEFVQEHTYVFEETEFRKIENVNMRKFNSLKSKQVLSFNSKSKIDEDLIKTITLQSFSSIDLADFDDVNITAIEAGKILAVLLKNEIIVLNDTKYRLNIQYDEIQNIQLEPFPIYEDAVKVLLRHCFAYTIAIQRIIRQMEEHGSPIFINLLSEPHKMLLKGLLDEDVITHGKVIMPLKDDLEKVLKNIINKYWFPSDKTISNIASTLKQLSGGLESVTHVQVKLTSLLDLGESGNPEKLNVFNLFSLNGLDQCIVFKEKGILRIILDLAARPFKREIRMLSGYYAKVRTFFSHPIIRSLIGMASKGNFGRQIQIIVNTCSTFDTAFLRKKAEKILCYADDKISQLFNDNSCKTLNIGENEIAKIIISNTKSAVSMGFVSEGVEKLVKNYLQKFCKTLQECIRLKVQDKIDFYKVSEFFENAYQRLGPEAAQFGLAETRRKVLNKRSIEQNFAQIFQNITRNVLDAIKINSKPMSLRLNDKTLQKFVIWSNMQDDIDDIAKATTRLLDYAMKEINSHWQTQIESIDDQEAFEMVEEPQHIQVNCKALVPKFFEELQNQLKTLLEEHIAVPIITKGGVILIGRWLTLLPENDRYDSDNRHEMVLHNYRELLAGESQKTSEKVFATNDYIRDLCYKNCQRLEEKGKGSARNSSPGIKDILAEIENVDLSLYKQLKNLIDHRLNENWWRVGAKTNNLQYRSLENLCRTKNENFTDSNRIKQEYQIYFLLDTLDRVIETKGISSESKTELRKAKIKIHQNVKPVFKDSLDKIINKKSISSKTKPKFDSIETNIMAMEIEEVYQRTKIDYVGIFKSKESPV